MTIRAGKLRERITFQSATRVRSPFGDGEATWADYKTVWADVRMNPQTESEGVRDARTQVLEAEIRYRTGITQDMRVVVRGNAFDITGVADEEGRKRSLIVRGVWRG
jgi:SPP1 family predicted phage head-tail adaptor